MPQITGLPPDGIPDSLRTTKRKNPVHQLSLQRNPKQRKKPQSKTADPKNFIKRLKNNPARIVFLFN
jgi:hypothetical protein